MVFSGAIHGVD